MSNQLFIYPQYYTNAIPFFPINSLYKDGIFIFVITPLSTVVTLLYPAVHFTAEDVFPTKPLA